MICIKKAVHGQLVTKFSSMKVTSTNELASKTQYDSEKQGSWEEDWRC